MNLTDSDLKCVASGRANKPFSFWLRNGTLLAILIVIFLAAIDMMKLVWFVAALWTLTCIYIFFLIHRRKDRIFQELKHEQQDEE